MTDSNRNSPSTDRCRRSVGEDWRAWLTDHLLDRWLAKGRYYQLNLVIGDHQNPEGRIAEDVRVATEAPVDFRKLIFEHKPGGSRLISENIFAPSNSFLSHLLAWLRGWRPAMS